MQTSLERSGTYPYLPFTKEIVEARRGTPVADISWKSHAAGLCEMIDYRKGLSQLEKENAMAVFLTLEASQPCGANYRLAIGCFLHPKLASMVIAFMRLY